MAMGCVSRWMCLLLHPSGLGRLHCWFLSFPASLARSLARSLSLSLRVSLFLSKDVRAHCHPDSACGAAGKNLGIRLSYEPSATDKARRLMLEWACQEAKNREKGFKGGHKAQGRGGAAVRADIADFQLSRPKPPLTLIPKPYT